MNNKGIAISSVVYMILITFILLITSIIVMLVIRNTSLTRLKNEVKDELSIVKTITLVDVLLTNYDSSATTGLLLDDEGFYYSGNNLEVTNNYVSYEGYLWRILEFDEEKIRLVLNDAVNVDLSSDAVWTSKATYDTSDFYSYFNDFKTKFVDPSILLETTYNIGPSTSATSIQGTGTIGSLSLDEYVRSGDTNTFINSTKNFWLATPSSTQLYYVSNNTKSVTTLKNNYAIKPVIEIKTFENIIGDGSINSPYTIGDVVNPCLALVNTKYDFAYTGGVQQLTTTCSGNYKLEVWGAEGGYTTSETYGGDGGYTTGTINLLENTKLYIQVGGKGVQLTGGYNGGGSAANDTYDSFGGGGATDIRINTNSLYSRLIVAGGGGGANIRNSGASDSAGGYAGGTTGGSGGRVSTYTAATGGTQTSGGSRGYRSSSLYGYAGSFGVGGNASNTSGTSSGGGGGGGFYGGGSGHSGSSSSSGGAGGSSYTYTSSTASYCPSGCLLISQDYLANTQLLGGNQSFISPTGASETGHNGNGYARITYLG